MSRTSLRIQNQYRYMQKNPIQFILSAGPIAQDNWFHWQAKIQGPKDAPHANGIFTLEMIFPNQYPLLPIKCKFLTKIYHPNISSSGEICLDILRDQWSPALTSFTVLISIINIIGEPLLKDSQVPEIAQLYIRDRQHYEEIAKKWTKKYAQ